MSPVRVTAIPGPGRTRSYLVSVFDADAPSSSGLWHRSACKIPATARSLPAGEVTWALACPATPDGGTGSMVFRPGRAERPDPRPARALGVSDAGVYAPKS